MSDLQESAIPPPVRLTSTTNPLVEAWVCGVCGGLHSTVASASKCCNWPCDMCGKQCEKFWLRCAKCRDAEQVRKRTDAIASYPTVKWKDYPPDAMVWCEAEDKWFSNLSDVEDAWFDSDDSLVLHADGTVDGLGIDQCTWVLLGATENKTSFDAMAIAEMLELDSDVHEDWYGFSEPAIDELQTLLDGWIAKHNPGNSWSQAKLRILP